MKAGVLVVNFGEPEASTPEAVVPVLERIFMTNARLSGAETQAAAKARSAQLAQGRAPGLIAEYQEIGGSPLNAQARFQASALEAELRRRGLDATCYPVFQFLEPFLEEGARRARADGVERLVVFPVYPLCGESTTVAALAEAERALAALEWNPEVLEIAGWHGHPGYLPFHARHILDFCSAARVDLRHPGTRLLFSIHGTPLRYLEEGNRYDRYVEEACRGIARGLGVDRYAMGYQNHTNRPVEWTQPDVEAVVDRLSGERVVVVAVSFMHEQSETLAELDRGLRARVESRGLAFHRVPIPHDHPTFIGILTDLVEGRLRADAGGPVDWRRCVCRGGGKARCTNGLLLDPVSVAVEGG